jgi:hypothetical protein
MLNRRELLNAIAECESSNESFQNCQKLATLYIIYDHLYSEPNSPEVERVQMNVIETDRNSEFMQLINGKQIEPVLDLVDELMETIKILQPRLYDSALRRLKDIV